VDLKKLFTHIALAEGGNCHFFNFILFSTHITVQIYGHILTFQLFPRRNENYFEKYFGCEGVLVGSIYKSWWHETQTKTETSEATPLTLSDIRSKPNQTATEPRAVHRA
tara:strand:+ start:2398 stop:2724 length:327 start_codon:yes stop_codon:yes gene_type:complete